MAAMASRKPKTWHEKLFNGVPHEIKTIAKDWAGQKAGATMLVPSGVILDEFIRKLPRGRVTPMPELRAQMAAAHGAAFACPIVSGIYLRMAAEAANEALENGAGAADVTPVWRVIDNTSPTVKKLTFDPAILFHQRDLEAAEA